MKAIKTYLTEEIERGKDARIFIVIKPGFLKYSQQILQAFFDEDWEIEKQTSKQLLLKEAQKLYSIHKKEDWYKPLCEYMSSEKTTAFILVNHNMKMSKTVFEHTSKIKDELREKYGESDMRNVIHSSDSLEHMKQEQAIYFAN